MVTTALYLKALALALVINTAPCPSEPEALGCADQPSRTVWVEPGAERQFALAHELGHLSDYWRLTDAERRRIGRHQDWEYWRPEGYADLFALCALAKHPESHPCALIRRTFHH